MRRDTPPRDMISPAKMKNGTDNNANLSNPPNMIWGIIVGGTFICVRIATLTVVSSTR